MLAIKYNTSQDRDRAKNNKLQSKADNSDSHSIRLAKGSFDGLFGQELADKQIVDNQWLVMSGTASYPNKFYFENNKADTFNCFSPANWSKFIRMILLLLFIIILLLFFQR